jgi:hypothetical protein
MVMVSRLYSGSLDSGVIKDPNRVLHGVTPSRPIQGPGVSSLLGKYDSGKCRELKQVHVSFPHSSALYTVAPSYMVISKRRLISGLTFMFSSGFCVNVGYIIGLQVDCSSLEPGAESLWLAYDPFRIRAVSTEQPFAEEVAMARWPLSRLNGVRLRLDVCVSSPSQTNTTNEARLCVL